MKSKNELKFIRLTVFALLSTLRATDAIPPDACQMLNQSQSIQCHFHTLSGDWTGLLARAELQSATGLHVDCTDPSAYPIILPPGAFASFPNLRRLQLDSCRLAELPTGSLHGLDHLQDLRIQTRNADWPGTSLVLSNELFGDVPALSSLDLAFNDMRLLPGSMLCPLHALARLNLTGNRLIDLKWIDSGCLSSLETLDVSYNRLVTLPPRSFVNASQLEELQLQGNGLVNVDDRSLIGLSFLRRINLAGNQLTSLPPGFFSYSAQVLREIYVGSNGLSVLVPGLFRGLEQLLVLDLSDNQLTASSFVSSTFAGLTRLAVLHLHNNKIARLDPGLFTDLSHLQILRLDGNLLETLPPSVFNPLAYLRTLVISRNRLSRIDAHQFANLHSLSVLALDNNAIEHVHSDALVNTTQLVDVNFSGNNLDSVPSALIGLTRLQSLDLGENRIVAFDHTTLNGMNDLTSLRLLDNQVGNITRLMFSNLPNLRILNLSKNQIGHVEQGAFSENRFLQAIRLDGNELADMSGLFNVLPNLLWLNISDNRLAHFDYALIPTSLQWLDIHSNLIPELGNYFQVDSQLSLQTLDASFNRLKELTASMLPDSLQILSLNDNLISSVQPYTFFRKDNLTRVDLYANHIAQLDENALRISPATDGRPLPEFYISGNPFECDCNMEWLQRINTPDHLRQHPRIMDLEGIYCRLMHSSRPQKTFVPLVDAKASNFLCTYETHCFALCHCCDFDACDCEMTCPNNCTCYHDQSWSVNVVDCAGVPYKELPERIPMDTTDLYLDGANMTTLSAHKFIGRKNLRQLFLNGSQVEAIQNRTFNGLRGLQVLHLENNHLQRLNGFEFTDLESLLELYLQNNAIAFIDKRTFSTSKHLLVLRLDGNKLVDFQPWNALTSQISLLRLNNNPWSCDCAFLADFRTFLRLAHSKVPDADRLTCWTQDLTPASLPILMPPEFQVQIANQSQLGTVGICVGSSGKSTTTTLVHQPIVHDYFPLLVSTLAVFLAVTCIALLGFVYRHPVRVWCYARYGLRVCPNKYDSPPTDGMHFDAFLSYSAKDDGFVQQMLATNLEYGSPTYKLCLQHRDCSASSNSYGLSEAISQAVESSRRTVIIISPNFIKTEWCRFEYKSALHQLFGNQRHCSTARNKPVKRLIVILIGDITHKDLDPDLKLYLKTSTSLNWGEANFWDKFRYALPDPAQQASSRNRPETRRMKSSVEEPQYSSVVNISAGLPALPNHPLMHSSSHVHVHHGHSQMSAASGSSNVGQIPRIVGIDVPKPPQSA